MGFPGKTEPAGPKTFVYDQKMHIPSSLNSSHTNNPRRLIPRNTASGSDSNQDDKHPGTQILFRNATPSEKTQQTNSPPVCKNCLTSTTPLWRRDENGAVLCNACGLFLKLHGRPRPISLKTDTIKSRNRKGTIHSEGTKNTNVLSIAPKKVSKPSSKKRKKNMEDGEPSKPPSKTSEIVDGLHTQGDYSNIQPRKHTSEVNKLNKHYHPSSVASNNSAYSGNLTNSISSPNNIPKPHTSSNSAATQLPSVSSLLSDINSEIKPVENDPSRKCFNDSRVLSHPNGIPSSFDIERNKNSSPSLLNPTMTSSIATSSNPHIQPNDTDNTDHLREHLKSDIPPPLIPSRHPAKFPVVLSLKDQLTSTRSNTQMPLNHPEALSLNVSPSLDNSDSITPFSSRDGDLQNVPVSGLDNVLHKMQSSDSIYDDSSQLSATLKNEEEIIKLRTKVEELEMMITMYKKHIFELDKKYQTLKEKVHEKDSHL